MSERIEIKGLVNNPTELGHHDLASLPGQIEDLSKIVAGREGIGVKFSSIIDMVGPHINAEYVTLEADGDFAASIPLKSILDQAIIWYGREGAPLSPSEGGPIRFLIPDPAACGTDVVDQCANVKWLKSIEVTLERGRDVRPTTLRAHQELHEKEKGEHQGE